jgi:putative Holliday junction resolvase
MARIIAFDIGTKRTGVAVSDPLQIIANGLTTIATSDFWTFFEQYLKTEQVECVVVGYPTQMDGSGSESLRVINPILHKFTQKYPHIKLVQFDERFTSKIAQRTMLDGGVKKQARQNKALVDTISATIILQDYMSRTKNMGY